jgi:hypothetical protein
VPPRGLKKKANQREVAALGEMLILEKREDSENERIVCRELITFNATRARCGA